MPARSTALMCTNTSLEPSAGWMNPKPFWALKNFTVPVAICRFPCVDTLVNQTHAYRAPGKASEFWEMTWGSAQKTGAYQGRPKSSCARFLYEYPPSVKPPAGAFSVTKAGHNGARSEPNRDQAVRSSWLCLAT